MYYRHEQAVVFSIPKFVLCRIEVTPRSDFSFAGVEQSCYSTATVDQISFPLHIIVINDCIYTARPSMS